MYSSAPPGGPARRGGNPPVNVPPPQIRGAPQSNMTGGPGMGAATAASSRIGEMLDQVKGEYEAIMQQHSMTKMEQIEMERKLQAQVVEMDQMQQTLKTLEANHRRIRQQYEEDMMRMRRQLEGQQAAGVKLPPKRHRTPTNTQGGPEGDPLMSVVAAAAASNRASGGRSNSPVRVMPVQPASRSLQQLGQPQTSGSSQLSPLENQATTPTNRRVAIPSLNSRNGDQENQNGKGESRERPLPPPNGPSGPSSPMSKKAKTEGGSIPTIKGTLPSVSAATSNASGSSLLPSTSKSSHDRQGSGGDLSPTGSNNTSQSQQMASSTPTPSNTSTSSKQGTPTSANQSGGSGTSTSGTSNPPSKSSKSGKASWNAVYSNSSSALPDSDRPVASILHEMNHQSVVCCVRFSADGTMMATGCHKTARVFDVKTSERKFIVSRPGSASNGNATNESDDAYVRAVCFSPDNTKLVAGMPQNTIRTWDIATNEEGPAMVGHELEIYSLDYVNDIIVSGSGDRKVRLWDARTGQCKKVFGSDSGGPSDGVTSVALSPDGRLIAAASLDKVVRIWDAETSQLMDRYEGHSDSVYSIAFSPDGKNVISGSLDKNIMLWDVNGQGRASSRPRMVFQGHKDFVLSVAYTPDGMLMSGSKDRSVVFWEPRSASPVLTLTGYRNSVISVAASPSTPYVGTGSGDCLAAIWNYQCQSF